MKIIHAIESVAAFFGVSNLTVCFALVLVLGLLAHLSDTFHRRLDITTAIQRAKRDNPNTK